MPYTAVPGNPVRRLQAVRLRPRARDRDARALSRDEERDRQHRLAPDQPVRPVARSRYRWTVLAAGTFAQASFAAIGVGLPAIAPAIRDTFGLSLAQVGAVLSPTGSARSCHAARRGASLDRRIGERLVLATGLGTCGAPARGGRRSGDVLAARRAARPRRSGRGERERGERARRDALVRRRAARARARDPAGGGPDRRPRGGVRPAAARRCSGPFASSGWLCLLGALAGRSSSAEPSALPVEGRRRVDTPGSPALAPLLGSGLYVVAQMAIIGFVVLFLHDERGFSTGPGGGGARRRAGGGMRARIGAGHWSDVLGRGSAAARGSASRCASRSRVVTVLLDGPLLAARARPSSFAGADDGWNGVAFAAAAELAAAARTGAAIGFQQTMLSALGIAAPARLRGVVRRVLAASPTGWRRSFPLAGAWLCGRSRRSAPEGRCDRDRFPREDPRATRAARRDRRPDRLLARGGRGARAGGRLVPRGRARGRGRRGGEPDRADSRRRAQVWTGSHLDTVPRRGRFDGALGVVAGIEAVEALGLPVSASSSSATRSGAAPAAARVSRAARRTRTSSSTSSRGPCSSARTRRSAS